MSLFDNVIFDFLSFHFYLAGLGYGTTVVLLYSSIYYIIIMAWGFFYLFSSFSNELPWASCNNVWNTGKRLYY